MSDPVCIGAFDPGLLGWDKNFDGYNFSLGMDVQSFTIAMAVNLGYISLDTLEIAQTFNWQFTTPTSANSTYEANLYYDLRYPSMKLILCVRNITAIPEGVITFLCVLQLNEIFLGLPIFTSSSMYSQEKGGFVPCNCSQIETDSNLRQNCDMFDFLSGYLFYNIYDPSASAQDNLGNQLWAFVTALDKYPSYADFNNALLAALQLTSVFISGVVDYNLVPQYVIEYVLSPCFVFGEYGCSLIMFQSYDYINNQVSEFHYQLYYGSCRDSFSIHSDKW